VTTVLQILSDGRTKDDVIAQNDERLLKCLEKRGEYWICQENGTDMTDRIQERQRSRRLRTPWTENLGEHRWEMGGWIG
jgi:hypothetical protein